VGHAISLLACFAPFASSLFRAYRHFMLAKDHAARSARFPIDTRHFMMMK
jgi:hypothetical protein